MKHQHRINGNHLQKPKLTKVAVTVLVILSSYAHANSEKLVNPANNHAYQRLDSALDWNTAKTVCSNMGAHLATITSQAENDWITNNFTTGVNGFWLGGTDDGHEGTWNWITNETWNYTNWNSPQPDNYDNEDYLNMYGSTLSVAGTWNDCNTFSANCISAISGYLCEWKPSPTTSIYNNDFNTSAGAEWTYPTIATSNGEKFLGANAYGFGASSNTLTLNNLPAHTKVTVDFDLYIIQSWDGNSDNCGGCGPDNWQLTADEINLLLTIFSNTSATQAYPNQLPPYGSGGTFAPNTGAFETGHLELSATTYRLSYTFEHTATSVALKFTGMQNEAANNEGWGLDNVRVSINTQAPLVTTLPVTNITATSANLNAQVNSNGSDAIVGFNLGPTTTYGTNVAAVPDVVSGTAAVTGTATGLTCNTIYHYRIEATNSFGSNYGADQSFTTGVCPVPPTAITNAATGVNATAAILNGSVNPNGIAVTAVSFDYGSTTAYGASVNANPNTINAGFNPVNVSAVKGGFTCNTTYHYRLTATNDYGTGYGADKTFTTTTANCQAAPVVVTTAPTLITVASATLNGQVTSNPVTTAVSFDFGRTNAYGTNVTATSNQIYSATPVAISAVKTALSCATEYHYRAKAVNSIGTGFGADQSFTTETCPPAVNAWLNPPNLTIIRNQPFTLDLMVNSNSVQVGSYNFTVTWDATTLVLNPAQCPQGVCPGNDAVDNRANIINDAASITLTGNDNTGVGPGNDLQLLKLHFKTKLITGATSINLTTTTLNTPEGGNIGLAARGATVNVSYGYCGDSDGNTRVNIVDALAIARKLVGLPPPPTIDDLLADTNKNARVDINDALFIARYAVGLVLPPEACNLGQPL